MAVVCFAVLVWARWSSLVQRPYAVAFKAWLMHDLRSQNSARIFKDCPASQIMEVGDARGGDSLPNFSGANPSTRDNRDRVLVNSKLLGT